MLLTDTFAQLVTILNDGQYHDGTTLGDKLGITRSAVWKIIKKLENYDIKIDSVKGKGYALLEPLILLNKKTIKKNIAYQDVDIQVFENIDSTNDYLKSSLSGKSQSAKICLAEQQLKGKGRFNREWHSPFGQNIYLSYSYHFQKDVSALSGLSLVVNLAAIKTLAAFSLPESLLMKWPNDILYQHKKLSGCLIEIQAESHGSCHAIVGIGINVNMLLNSNTPISTQWTSLRNIIGTYIDRNLLCIALIDNLLNYMKLFEKHGLTYFLEEWKSVDYLYNKDITLKHVDKKIHGKSKGIDHLGHLVLKLQDGTLRSFSSGDTSIMK